MGSVLECCSSVLAVFVADSGVEVEYSSSECNSE